VESQACSDDDVQYDSQLDTEDPLVLKERARLWMECQCRASAHSEVFYARPLMSTHIVRAGNSSSPCYRRVNKDMLIGYIAKRRNYRGMVLGLLLTTVW
jgi:hypothetical protein